ncbi:Arc family DNA-binding protein [Streptomyces sp. NPDC014724]|uniref:Arc family DNA-binding protein n=1 Tax=unclassified Streptomyces TaxID=2593676 RepID=UPI0037025B30
MDEQTRITLRLPTDLHTRLADHAKRDRRSLNSEIVHLLEVALGAAAGDAGSPDGKSA